jgi:hypothetical protein
MIHASDVTAAYPFVSVILPIRNEARFSACRLDT